MTNIARGSRLRILEEEEVAEIPPMPEEPLVPLMQQATPTSSSSRGLQPALTEVDYAELLKKIELIATAKVAAHLEAVDKQHKAVLDVVLSTSRVALATLFQWLLPLLATVGGFWLWNKVLATPDVFQLTGLGLYGAFVILPIIYFTVRHRK